MHKTFKNYILWLMIVKHCKTRVFYIKIIRKYMCLCVRNVFYFLKKVRLFSQNGVLFLFYFLINPTMTTGKTSFQPKESGRKFQIRELFQQWFDSRNLRGFWEVHRNWCYCKHYPNETAGLIKFFFWLKCLGEKNQGKILGNQGISRDDWEPYS